MLTSCRAASPLARVQITRTLPYEGNILVRIGDAVQPTQIIGEAIPPADFRIVDVARALEVSAEQVGKYLQVKRGQEISTGDVLAAKGFLSSRVCKSPIDGRVLAIGRGRLLLEERTSVLRVSALVPGHIVDVHPGHVAIVETVGGYIEAAWGNGRESYGTLRPMTRAPDHPIRAVHIDASCQGALLIGGTIADEETIQQAISVQALGLIVGSVSPMLLSAAEHAMLPILATEGIGTTPMAEAVFKLLTSLEGRGAAVDGDIGQRWERRYPFVVVPMPTRAAQPLNCDRPLAIGDLIRILRGPHRGHSATVTRLDVTTTLKTGARVPGVEATLADETPVRVSYANVERLLR